MSSTFIPAKVPSAIAAHLRRITHQRFFRTYEDWLALAVNAFLRDEEAYMAIMHRYGPREAPMGEIDHPADHFARALGTWMQAMKLAPADYLGQVYEEQAVANQFAGQYFTPEPLVELMAAITIPEVPDDALVHDPACGSGRMLVAGIRKNRYATFVGVDTDLLCVHMTTLNCLVRNANTWIIHGNSLTLQAQSGYHVRRTPFGGELFRLSAEQAAQVLQAPLRGRADASTALAPPETPASISIVPDASPEARAAFEDLARQFTTDKHGQGDFGF